jgi:molecular chaperone DnaK
MASAVGIDLGTTKSVISICRRRVPETILVDGRATLPSVVSFRDGETALVGRGAKARVIIDPQNTISSAKRFMGDHSKIYKVNRKTLTPVNIASIVLKKLVEAARQGLGVEIWDVVITVPAYFNDDQREDTKRAGEEAGLNVLRLMPEPTAAALAYALDKGKDQTVMVYDLGGGTFDVTILEVKGNKFEVKAVGGDSRLGGDDFDERLMDWANRKFKERTGIDVLRGGVTRESLVARQRLKEACEAAKIELSEANSAMITVPNYMGHPLELEISRREFEYEISQLLGRTVECMKTVLRDTKMRATDIDRVILVGGSTKMNAVQRIVAEEIKDPFISEHVEEVVSHGAAIMAANLFLPEEDSTPIEISEVTAHTLGIDTINNNNHVVFRPIIPRQTPYPCSRGFLGSTNRPGQDAVNMQVFRGESTDPAQNVHLGKISLPVIPPQQQLVPIGAIFELDSDGIIHFTAVQLPQGVGLQPLIEFAIEHNGDLDMQSIQRLIKTGQANMKTVDVKYQK